MYAGVPSCERTFVRQELERKYVAMKRDIHDAYSKLSTGQSAWLILL